MLIAAAKLSTKFQRKEILDRKEGAVWVEEGAVTIFITMLFYLCAEFKRETSYCIANSFRRRFDCGFNAIRSE